MTFFYKKNYQSGLSLVAVIVFMSIAFMMVTSFVGWVTSSIFLAQRSVQQELAFHVAESGIDYYRWHLAHDPTDYEDGTGDATVTGPPTQDLLIWVDAQDVNAGGSDPADGARITTWQDKSGNNNDLTSSSSGTDAPYYDEDGFNSLPTIVINDNDYGYEFPAGFSSSGDDFTIIAVLQQDEGNSGYDGFYFYDQNSGGRFIVSQGYSSFSDNLFYADGAWGPTGFDDNGNNIASWKFDPNGTPEFSFRRNRSETTTFQYDENITLSSDAVLGQRYASASRDNFDGKISELLIYDRALDEDDIISIERYLDCKWDVTSPTDCTSLVPGQTYGPFTHDVLNTVGETVGSYSLMITAPNIGSSEVVVESTGTAVGRVEASRTIRATFASPSFAKYAVAANDTMRFGSGTETFGPLHSNGGIRFDGFANNVVTSSLEQYDDPDHSGSDEFGVHTHVSPTDPNPPNAVPDRLDVFSAGREFPVPVIDFSGLSGDISEMQSIAVTDGSYYPDSGDDGYRIVLKTDDTYDLYRVTRLEGASRSCRESDNDWGTWSIQNDTFMANHDFPTNGVIFVDDHLWVEGQIDEANITIVAGHFPDTASQRKSITVNNDLLYTNYDGSDSIALVAQDHINVGLDSQDDLRIDAALVAQNGRVGRHYYSSSCGSNYIRDTITSYGMIATNDRYGFAWTDGTGYQDRNLIYDGNLLYNPPPAFPVSTDGYELVIWEEI